MSERSELPNQARLDALREKGIVAVSPLAARSLTALVSLAVLFLSAGELAEIQREYAALGGRADAPLADLGLLAARLFVCSLVATGAGSLVALAAGLAQTRAHFRLPDLGGKRQHSRREALHVLIEECIGGILIAGCAAAILGFGVPAVFGLLKLAPGGLAAGAADAWRDALTVILPALGLLAILAVIFRRLGFLVQHRTSKRKAEEGHESSETTS